TCDQFIHYADTVGVAYQFLRNTKSGPVVVTRWAGAKRVGHTAVQILCTATFTVEPDPKRPTRVDCGQTRDLKFQCTAGGRLGGPEPEIYCLRWTGSPKGCNPCVTDVARYDREVLEHESQHVLNYLTVTSDFNSGNIAVGSEPNGAMPMRPLAACAG